EEHRVGSHDDGADPCLPDRLEDPLQVARLARLEPLHREPRSPRRILDLFALDRSGRARWIQEHGHTADRRDDLTRQRDEFPAPEGRDEMGGGGDGRRVQEADAIEFPGLLRLGHERSDDDRKRDDDSKRRAAHQTTAIASISMRYSGAASAPIWTIVDAGSWS